MTAHADELEARLNGQGGMLLNLAGILRVRRPKLTPTPLKTSPGTPPEKEKKFEPSTGLSELGRKLDEGDAAARRAAERGEYPSLLPGLSGTARSVLVFGIAALVILGLQGLAFARTGTETNPIMVLFVIPLIGS